MTVCVWFPLDLRLVSITEVSIKTGSTSTPLKVLLMKISFKRGITIFEFAPLRPTEPESFLSLPKFYVTRMDSSI